MVGGKSLLLKACQVSSWSRYTYGEDTYRKTVDFHLSALNPRAPMVSDRSRGSYDFDKPENITDLYRQSNQTN